MLQVAVLCANVATYTRENLKKNNRKQEEYYLSISFPLHANICTAVEKHSISICTIKVEKNYHFFPDFQVKLLSSRVRDIKRKKRRTFNSYTQLLKHFVYEYRRNISSHEKSLHHLVPNRKKEKRNIAVTYNC